MRIILVGTGAISKKYHKSLKDKYDIVGVVDINKNASGLKYFKDYPYYDNLDSAIYESKPEVMLIATPPSTHFSLIKKGLLNDLNVIVEKLVAYNLSDLEKIKSLMREKNKYVKVMYHWQFGNEMINFKPLDKEVKSISIIINETYLKDSFKLKPLTKGLDNALIDGLPNALSVLSKIININNLVLINYSNEKNTNGLIIGCKMKFKINETIIHINLSWSIREAVKMTVVEYFDEKIVIDHLEESVKINDDFFNYKSSDRLETHYFNIFESLKNDSYISLPDDILQEKIVEIVEVINNEKSE